MTTTRAENSGAGRKQVLFEMEIDTLDPHMLAVENNLLRALVERLELLAGARTPRGPIKEADHEKAYRR
jgi:hypothetical protein